MQLKCISLGPLGSGRDYGLLPRFRSMRLPSEVAARLGDFALALFDWGLEQPPPFAIFFPLDSRGSLHLLARAAFLRLDTLGPVVIANGLLLDQAALAACQWRPDRLLHSVHPPEDGEWPDLEVPLQISEIGHSAPHPDLGKFARSFQFGAGQWRMDLVDGQPPESVIADILNATRADLQLHTSWATSGSLPQIGRFNPAELDLLVYPASRNAPAAPGTYRLAETGLSGPPLPESETARLWAALFPEKLPAAWVKAFPTAAAACGAINYPRGQVDDDPQPVLVESMMETLGQPGIESDQFWGLMELWAEVAETQRSSVIALAIGTVFRRVLEGQPDAHTKAALLSGYLAKLWNELSEGPKMLPAALAVNHGLIGELDTRDLALLVPNGLAETYAGKTQEAVESGALPAGKVAGLAGALRNVLEGNRAPPPQTVSLALATARAAAAAGRQGQAPFEAVVPPALNLADHLLVQTGSKSVLNEAIAIVADCWGQAEGFQKPGPRFAEIARAFWKNPKDQAARRRGLAVVAAAKLA